MAAADSTANGPVPDDAGPKLEDIEYTGRKMGPRLAVVVSVIAALWSLYQLWIASPLPFMVGFGIFSDVPARAIHLGFALLLCYLMFPISRHLAERRIPVYDIVLAVLASGAALYLYFMWGSMSLRPGSLLVVGIAGIQVPVEAIVGGIGIVLLLEATRRCIGLPLVIVASVFLVYSIFGQSMPDIISHKGVSLERLVGYQWLTGEAIFGIPIDVSVSFVFLFVLFGALLDRAGAGKYFLDLAFAMVGKYSGGPAKAAILASGMTGLISGSSIANVVTTGTFTIPVMRRIGLPAVKAGAIEVAASTNGQIMPPIMGAAAFIIAELLGISYFDVIVSAAVPALLSYSALLYISHLEAMKLGLRGLPKAELPRLREVFFGGLHYLIPIVILVYLLMVERWTAGSAVFYSIIIMMGIMVGQHVLVAARDSTMTAMQGVKDGLLEVYEGMVAGARNMINIGVAVAAAGIIVGAVSSTGLNNAMVGVVEAISGGNVYILLFLTAILCLILGMGLPTTANYLVVASLLAGVLVELGSAAGLVIPLIAVHLFVFYFGLMADSTPPVCLAAFAASAISRADPLRTGVQSFLYDIRTGVLPFVFIFNPELLLIGVESVWHGMLVVFVSLIAIFCFSSVTQGWYIVKVRAHEAVLLVAVMFGLFRPDYVMDQIYAPFETVPLDKFMAGEISPEAGRKLRLHVVRETDYGDRFKLFVLHTPEGGVAGDAGKAFGVTLEPESDGRYAVADLAFNGLAEAAGMDFGDFVTEVDVERLGQPPKELVYPFALALLVLVTLMQLARRRRQGAAVAVAAGS